MSTDTARPTRDRLLDATVALMRAKGAAASGTKEILDLAGAPRGSFYFHFSEGKDQLILEALERAAAATLASLEESLADDNGDLTAQVRAIFDAIELDLVAHDYTRGCAVAVTTMESASASQKFQQAVSDAFGTWTSALVDRLTRRGLSADQAPALADAIVAAMEGATVLARAHRSPTPLRHTADMLAITIGAVTGQSTATTKSRAGRTRRV
jgi:TetR/AcrR family transcriptional repressor of lmrAB and yxaGH operons